MVLDFLLVVAAFVLLVLGAEGLVRGSAAIALRAGLPPLIVGLTFVAFGTSAPELVVSVEAVLSDQGDIAVGNVVGSNIFNIALILGLTALIHPLRIHPRIARLDAPVALLAAVVLPMLLWNRILTPMEGGLLLAGLAACTLNGFRLARAGSPDAGSPDAGSPDAGSPYAGSPGATAPEAGFEEDLPAPSKRWQIDVGYILGGLVLLVLGSRLLVGNAVDLARGFGVSEAVIGLTIVAAGTSAPELATSIVAALRRQADIAIGNVVGSNLFNMLGILGVASLVGELRTTGISVVDYGTMIGLSALLVLIAQRRPMLGRAEGALLLACYGAYMFVLWPT